MALAVEVPMPVPAAAAIAVEVSPDEELGRVVDVIEVLAARCWWTRVWSAAVVLIVVGGTLLLAWSGVDALVTITCLLVWVWLIPVAIAIARDAGRRRAKLLLLSFRVANDSRGMLTRALQDGTLASRLVGFLDQAYAVYHDAA
jgi:hypothetical protein